MMGMASSFKIKIYIKYKKEKKEIKCSKNLIWEIFDKESFNDAKKGAKTNSPLLKGRGPGQKMWLKQEYLLKSASREVEDSLYSGFAIFKTAKKLIFTIVFTFQHQSRNIWIHKKLQKKHRSHTHIHSNHSITLEL